MKNWDTDKLIGLGLLAALLLKIAGDTVITLYGLSVPAGDLAANIVSGLVGYMGKSLIDQFHKNDLGGR